MLEGRPFAFTTEESRVQIHINMLMTFLKIRGQLWAFEGFRTQMGIATVPSASIADINRSPAHISVGSVLQKYCSVILEFLRYFIVIAVFLSNGQFVDTRTIVFPSVLFRLGNKRILSPCFDHLCLFQLLLHHCFVCLLKHIGTISQCEKVYSL